MVQKIFTEQLTGTTLTLQSANGTPVVLSAANTGSLLQNQAQVGSGGGSSTTTYADMAALITETGMSDGDMAFVLATNNLYIYKTNGWFKIATVENLQPGSISGVDSSYNLATDGSNTVITATATDPEGFPLTWSYAVTTGSLANTATVSQVNNVFTITPSTTEADAGSFSITFSVTDGVNGAVNANSDFTLSFGWTVDVSAITSDSITFNSSESTSLRGYSFANDGTKMYCHDSVADDIFQYSLSTPWDISSSSVTYDGFLSNPDGTPIATVFNNDGTKAYILGMSLKRVYQYSLSTPYDLANATSDNVDFTVTGQVTTPHGIFLSPDGTKMFIADYSTPAIYQYSLSTAFDLSTISYDSVSFSVASQEGANGTRSVVFNELGTQMIICGTTSDSLHQYTLSTGFDLSTASYDGVNLDLNYNTVSVAFSSDGTKCYIANQTTRDLTQYSTNL